MGNLVVKVELIANPAVTRMMTEASLRSNSNKWRLAGMVAASEGNVSVKKKDVEPVEVKPIEESIFALPIAEIIESAGIKVPHETKPEDTLIGGLQAQYKAKFSKDPDKRWGVTRLTQEISKV